MHLHITALASSAIALSTTSSEFVSGSLLIFHTFFGGGMKVQVRCEYASSPCANASFCSLSRWKVIFPFWKKQENLRSLQGGRDKAYTRRRRHNEFYGDNVRWILRRRHTSFRNTVSTTLLGRLGKKWPTTPLRRIVIDGSEVLKPLVRQPATGVWVPIATIQTTII